MPIAAALACRALRTARCLQLVYGGYERIVEVHVVGRSGKKREIMRVWQVGGGSASGEGIGWKLLHLDEVRAGHLVDEPSLAPRSGYNRADPAMACGIICQI